MKLNLLVGKSVGKNFLSCWKVCWKLFLISNNVDNLLKLKEN